MGKRRGRTVRKNRSLAAQNNLNETENSKAPHSFVIHRGIVGKYLQDLTRDFRKVMEPFTASNIKVKKNNVLKDFVHISNHLNVTHMIAFSKTEIGPYMKIGRLPKGPTLTFRVKDYILSRDVRNSLKKQIIYEKQFQNPPLLILNNFKNNSKEMELLSNMFQNMFPSLNISKVKINTIRRCVLLNYDDETGTIDFRHYSIKVIPAGVSKSVKKIVVQGKVPNLSRYDNISDYVGTPGNLSDSEFEEDETSKVVLPQKFSSRGNIQTKHSSIRLVELGPRLQLELIKIEEDLYDGEVLYHKLVTKTPEEIKAIKKARLKKKAEKEKRKSQQAQNIKNKNRNNNKSSLPQKKSK